MNNGKGDDNLDIYEWPIIGTPSEYILGDEYPTKCKEDERWKDSTLPFIKVSNYGRFFNTKTRKFIKPTHGDNHGHKSIKTSCNGVRRQEYAHREIAKAFVSNPNNYPIVRHLNDNPDDNDIDNLAWGTQKDNHKDCVDNGRYRPFTDKDRRKSHDKAEQPVRLTNIKTGESIVAKSINEAARMIGAQQSNLLKVLNGTRRHTLGYNAERISKEEL